MLKHFSHHSRFIAGCDEAGRGCLSGPVAAAAVILPKTFYHKDLNDSKKLTAKKRSLIRRIIEKEALAFAVSFVHPKEIDRLNILNASFQAMYNALDNLAVSPTFIIVDGNRFIKYKNIDYETVVKGDSQYLCIAAASILAKTYRDEYMHEIHKEYPQYGWNQSKGYPTKKHRQAILKHGFTKYHRKSFKVNLSLF